MLGEGNTPLVESANQADLYYKKEGLNPTGSFKDRGTALKVKEAKEKGVSKLHICSSGNAALSLAVYCGKADLECICHVPESTSHGKKHLMETFGATVKEYEAIYEEIFHHLEKKDLSGWNVTPGASDKSMEAYEEIAEEISDSGVDPDQVVVPCGNGTNLAGIWKGFKKLGNSPEMIGVQMKGAAPIKKALEEGKCHGLVEDPESSEAEGIVAAESFHCAEAVKAIEESGGSLETVTEEEMKQGVEDLLNEGVICEPTSAVVKPVAENYSGTTVAVVTGSGLKNHGELVEMTRGSSQY